MEETLARLKPVALWQYFQEICRIPRPSKKEEKIARYLMDFAGKKGLNARQDSAGNVLIRKPASPGREKDKAVILQCHIDMVCEKNAATVHDFDKDPILPYADDGWVKAKGTTLGADDGIGIAAALAILDSKDISHGPLECLFTVDEETGLTGAFGLKAGFLEGSVLLNLDSEDEGQIFIGCAGGMDTVATFEASAEKVPSGSVAYRVGITGLKGGHSGDDINKGLGNAVKILGRFLWNASRKFDLKVATLSAGNLRNAIAREGFSEVIIPASKKKEFEAYVKEYHQVLTEELHVTEPGLQFNAEPTDKPTAIMSGDLQNRVLNSLYACPHGVIEYSREIQGFVETSTNLASVRSDEKQVLVTTSQRSSVESSKRDVADMVESVFLLGGARVEHSTGYPGWRPDPGSQVLKATVESYRKLFGEDPKVLAIHAGLECGLIGAIYPGMDMVSFGPTIKGAHSPDERLDIRSTEKFWELLVEVLKRI
ncbi:MAG TPA: aminoacyl-histidine dipeptidase [Bacteroidales bacterium]|nr:aminoacyl-histidine dipeptidase [Bacteroidales bacterium]